MTGSGTTSQSPQQRCSAKTVAAFGWAGLGRVELGRAAPGRAGLGWAGLTGLAKQAASSASSWPPAALVTNAPGQVHLTLSCPVLSRRILCSPRQQLKYTRCANSGVALYFRTARACRKPLSGSAADGYQFRAGSFVTNELIGRAQPSKATTTTPTAPTTTNPSI